MHRSVSRGRWRGSPPSSRSACSPLLAARRGLGGCSLGDDADERPPPARRQVRRRGRRGRSSASPRRHQATPSASAAATRSPTPPAWPARCSPPPTSDPRPTAVVLVDKDDWQGAIAAVVLSGAPMRRADAADRRRRAAGGDRGHARAPRARRARDLAQDAQVIRDRGGAAAARRASRARVIKGDDPYERAAAIDRFASSARGKPSRERGGGLRRGARVRDAGRRLGRAARATPCCSSSRTRCPAATREALARAREAATSTCSARSR